MEKLSSKNSAFLAAISAVLTSLSQITEGWYLSLFSLVPLYLCLFYTRGRQTVTAVWTFMLIYHGILCSFLTTLYDYLSIPALLSVLLCISAVLALSAFMSLVMFIAVYPAIKLDAKSAMMKITVFSACFSLGQFLMEMIPFLSFPWAKLETALAFQPILLQSAALFGGNFTAFLILIFNGLVCCILCSLFSENIRMTLKYSAFISVFFSVILAGGAMYMYGKKSGNTITVTAVQGSEEGMLKTSQSSQQAAEQYSDLISALPDMKRDVILLPETAIPSVLTEENLAILSEGVKDTSVVVTGCVYADESGRRYNCLTSLGNKPSRHLKQVLVPFGEYMPFFRIEGFASLTPSDTGGSIMLGGKSYAALICIESIYSSLLSPQIDSGCEMILLSTNDSWFKNSFARQLHFRHSIVRAVEYDRYLLRSGNCGISALIDRNGNIVAAQYGKESSALTAAAQLLKTKTVYSKLGNIFQIPAMLFAASFYLFMILRKMTDVVI